MASSIVDIDSLVEEWAWGQFKDIQSLKKTRLSEFLGLEKEEVEFCMNRRHLVTQHDEPEYSEMQHAGSKPYTLFKSIYTNNTNRTQEYSFKTERSTESLCAVSREQGYMIGAEAELTLKTPCEIAELKAGFKHEMHFNNMNENAQTECLSWGVDSNVTVPPHFSTEASIVIEEMNYRGTYTVTSKLSGYVVISIRRRRDGLLVLPIRASIVEIFRSHLDSAHPRKEVKQTAMIEGGKWVKLISKGTCHFQFAMKQRIDLKEKPIEGNEQMMID